MPTAGQQSKAGSQMVDSRLLLCHDEGARLGFASCLNATMLPASVSRRTFVAGGGVSLGAMALSTLLGRSLPAATSELKSRGLLQPLHHRPRIKRVIWLYMSGGPSHLETFDYKPELARRGGEPMPDSVTSGQPIAQLQGQNQLKILAPLFEFQRHGQAGQEISSALPHIAGIADDICIIR